MLPEAIHPRLREGSRPGNLVPDSKSFASESAVISGREQVPSGSEVRADDSVYLDKTLACRADLNRRIRFSRSRVGWPQDQVTLQRSTPTLASASSMACA